MRSYLKKQKGNVLLLSLLLLAALVSTITLLTRQILNEYKLSTNLNSSMYAYYGAEQAMEQGLYLIRKTNTKAEDVDTDGVENGVKWKREILTTVPSIIGDIEQNKSVELDLFDPDNSANPCNIESLEITWTDNASFLEITIIEWTPAATITYPETPIKLQYTGGKAVINNISAIKAYKVLIKALYANVDNLEIKAYNLDNGSSGGGSLVPITNYLTMKTTGRYSRSDQMIEAIVPRIAPVSGLFDYVIFSEQTIEK